MDFIVLDELGYLPFARTGGRDNYACRLSHAPPPSNGPIYDILTRL
jgi:hypothetical protein